MKGAWLPHDLFTIPREPILIEPDFAPIVPTWAATQQLPFAMTEKDFQAAGTSWLVQRQRGLLHDEQGLGKTKQIIDAIDLVARREGPQDVLFLSLAGGLDTLKAEIERFAPHFEVFLYRGSDRYKKYTSWKPKNPGSTVIVLCSYANFRTDAEFLSRVSWTWAVCDEGDAIRSCPLNEESMSQIAQVIHMLQPQRRHILTATPIVSDVHDLWNQFRWLGVEERDWPQFESDTLVVTEKRVGFDTYRRKVSRTRPQGEQRMKFMLASHGLGRTENEVGANLPPLIETMHKVPMTGAIRQQYKALEQAYIASADKAMYDGRPWGPHYKKMAEIKRLLSHAVLPYAVELTDRIVAGGGAKVVVFTQYRDVLESLQRQFLNPAVIHGDVSTLPTQLETSLRQREVDRFIKDPECKILCCTVQTMQRMYTLTVATHCIFIDKEWNAASSRQGMKRIRRIGQTRTTYAHTLHAIYPDGSPTFHEKIEKVIQRRGKLADDIAHGRASAQDFALVLKG